MKRELLFSVKKEDLVEQTFRAGGKGGQAQNKKSTGVRLIHPPSGARGEARDSRSQHQNRVAAWHRMIETPEFQSWLRTTTAVAMGMPSIEKIVDEQMRPENIRVQVKDDQGRWVDAP